MKQIMLVRIIGQSNCNPYTLHGLYIAKAKQDMPDEGFVIGDENSCHVNSEQKFYQTVRTRLVIVGSG